MKTILCNKIARVAKNHKRLMDLLGVKITNRGKEVTIEGSAENEHEAVQVIDALNLGFPYIEAISIKAENKILEHVNIKEHTHQKNLERVRGRVIGQGGKSLKTLSDLTNSAMALNENTVSIISEPENMERATEALIAIIKGAKHGSTYKDLEKNMPKPIYDLGLRDQPVKTMEEYEKALKDSKNTE